MMKIFSNEESRFNEMVFEGRNKAYGAYALRAQEGSNLAKALFIGIGLFAGVSAVPLAINYFKKPVPTIIPEQTAPPKMVQIYEKLPPEKVTPQTPKQDVVKQINTTVPTPKAHPDKEKPAVKVSDYDHAVAGTVDIQGAPKPEAYTPPQVDVVAPPKITTTPAVQPVEDNSPKTAVDVEAAFSGGIDAFRGKVQNNFDVSAFEGTDGLLKATVSFIVEKDGTISAVKASGNDARFNAEAEKTVRSVKGRWMPAKIGGQAVRSYFRFPLTMKFE